MCFEEEWDIIRNRLVTILSIAMTVFIHLFVIIPSVFMDMQIRVMALVKGCLLYLLLLHFKKIQISFMNFID